MEQPILTVSQLTDAIKHRLESGFPLIHLEGEVSNCKLHSSGHLYFSLKDPQAQIAAVMFRAYAQNLSSPVKDGDRVVVVGSLNVYPPSGRYQVMVTELRQAGLGVLLLKLEALKKEIARRGWFAAQHKKQLPKFPRKIGVITSPTGAVIQDILHILKRRHAGFHLVLNPVKVQGEGAAAEIKRAVEQFNQHKLVDVIILGRGGGSIEDLWAFNEEAVAEAIFHSQIPIIAAIGHETDHTIADYVADVRAPTPSAAAELVMKETAELTAFLQQTQRRLQQTLSHLLRQYRQQLTSISKQPVFRSPYALIGPWMQRLDEFRQSVDIIILRQIEEKKRRLTSCFKLVQTLKPSYKLQQFKKRIEQVDRNLTQNIQRQLAWRREKLKSLENALRAVDPKNLLRKGYTILFSEKEGLVINSSKALKEGERVQLLFADGKALALIEKVAHG